MGLFWHPAVLLIMFSLLINNNYWLCFDMFICYTN